MNFEGKVSLITGSSRGIGREIAAAFAAKGSVVYINGTKEKTVDEGCSYIESLGYKCNKLVFDISDFNEVQNGFNHIYLKEGKLDILVNNAGILRDSTLNKMTEEDWDTVIRINLKSIFNCCKNALPKMIEKGYGRIINISSVIGLKGGFGQTNYAASKAGIIGFTKSLAYETARKGLTVNVVAPGFIETDMIRDIPENVLEKIIAQIPMSRLGTPENVASMVLYLASDEASYITGQVFNVNGGLLMP